MQGPQSLWEVFGAITLCAVDLACRLDLHTVVLIGDPCEHVPGPTACSQSGACSEERGMACLCMSDVDDAGKKKRPVLHL